MFDLDWGWVLVVLIGDLELCCVMFLLLCGLVVEWIDD